MHVRIENDWQDILKDEFEKDYFKTLTAQVELAYLNATPTYPPSEMIFNAFTLCPFSKIKVVILGQDPYHGPGQAHGLAFSVPESVNIPPSLRNIYKELNADVGRPRAAVSRGNLTKWATQGVLLLNSTLSVAAGRPNSHKNFGWETFTDAVITHISEQKDHVVFILWGGFAAKKAALIDKEKHFILTAPHPSPLSAHRGFFGSRHFSKTNTYLKNTGQTPISW